MAERGRVELTLDNIPLLRHGSLPDLPVVPHLPRARIEHSGHLNPAARGKNGRKFTSFLPAVSKDALKKMSAALRHWRLHRRTWHTITSLAGEITPSCGAGMQYYGAFYRSALLPLLRRINAYLMRWRCKKYKRLASKPKALACWQRITRQYPRLFAHWAWVSYSWWPG